MEITELYLKNFGKFSERHFFLNKGIHIFYGENEYGKTTIYEFIKAMFFGMERGRGRAALNDKFSRYEPWNNPNYYAGVMRFVSGGKNFRLERHFDRYSKGASLVCEDDGEELSLEDGDLEMLLGQVTSESFENTVAIGQLTAKPGSGLAEELNNYAANLYETGSGAVNLNAALDMLRLRKKTVEQEMKRSTDKQERKKDAVRQEIQYIENDEKRLQNELEDCYGKIKSESIEERTENTIYKKLFITGSIGIIAGLLGGTISMFSWVLLAAGLTILFISIVKYRKIDKNGYQTNQQKLQWEKQRIQEEIKEKQISLQNLREHLDELEMPSEEASKLKVTRQALLLAQDKIQEVSQSMAKGFGDTLNENASEILEQITNGRYTKLLIDTQLSMVLYKDGVRIPVERVSRGTMEQVYFALRMAVMDLLCEEPQPIILDDAFVYYDEKRLKSVLKWLSEQERQVIIFSCQKREQEIVKQF
ncbi:ATP-binding protein [Clostridium sp. C105KSO13]|uniref:ATP-binding protein n=1 Tax=Clostridium sp. C105KSO13 TaxID=1776045 RepID=UPI00074059A0|nr:AAA family ATPase [Clostridium sp. C105KSO13]CUX37541.1 chromosome segregation protein [Clostridium sp. C105KSO13]